MTDKHRRPYDDSYWVIPGRLLAGEYPGAEDPHDAAKKVGKVLAVGITYFLDLTSPNDGLHPYEPLLRESETAVVYSRREIRDMGCPSDKVMKDILDEIDLALDQGHNVYVHCWGGIGRTGTVVGCHLVRRGLAGDAALAEVALMYGTMSRRKVTMFPHSPQTERQRDFVRNWEEK